MSVVDEKSYSIVGISMITDETSGLKISHYPQSAAPAPSMCPPLTPALLVVAD